MKLNLFISYLFINKKPLLYNYIHHRKTFDTIIFKNNQFDIIHKIDFDIFEKIIDQSDHLYESIDSIHHHINFHEIINLFHNFFFLI